MHAHFITCQIAIWYDQTYLLLDLCIHSLSCFIIPKTKISICSFAFHHWNWLNSLIFIYTIFSFRKSVRKSLAQLVATIAKHDLPESKWPELFSFLEQFIRSVMADQREVANFVFFKNMNQEFPDMFEFQFIDQFA